MIDYNFLAKMNPTELQGQEFLCGCGKTHIATTKTVYASKDCWQNVSIEAKKLAPSCKLLFVCLAEDYEIEGKKVVEKLLSDGFDVEIKKLEKMTCFSERDVDALVECEGALQVISMGDCVLVDFVKLYAKKFRLPHICLPTYPDSDKYFAPYSTVRVVNVPIKVTAPPPTAIIFDFDFLKAKGLSSFRLGYGEIVSNYLEVFDRHISEKFASVPSCPFITELLTSSAELVSVAAEELCQEAENGLSHFVEAVMKSGFARQFSVEPFYDGAISTFEVLSAIRMAEGNLCDQSNDKFEIFCKLVKIYQYFFNSKLTEFGLLPDLDFRFDLLVNRLGVPEKAAGLMTSKMLSVSAYQYMTATVEKTRAYFADASNLLAQSLDEKVSTYYNLGDGGEFVSSSKEDLKVSIALSNELKGEFTTLTIMKYMGLLEDFLHA